MPSCRRLPIFVRRAVVEVYVFKLPGRWHELIDHLCTDLGRETPGTENFQINIDHEISEAEARASNSEAIPFGETPEQRKREFQEALRKTSTRGSGPQFIE